MVDFTQLIKPKNHPDHSNYVSGSNVYGGNLDKFDQLFSQINLGGFDDNLNANNKLDAPVKAEEYVHALNMLNINEMYNNINISLNYIRQDEDYIKYKNKINDLLRVNNCESIAQLISEHYENAEVIQTVVDLQNIFDNKPEMKEHYSEISNKTKLIDTQLNENREDLISFNFNELQETEHQYLVEIMQIRSSISDGLGSLDIPFMENETDLCKKLIENLELDKQAIHLVQELISSEKLDFINKLHITLPESLEPKKLEEKTVDNKGLSL